MFKFKIIKAIFTRRYLCKLYFVPFEDENKKPVRIVRTEIFAPDLKKGDEIKIHGYNFIYVGKCLGELVLRRKQDSDEGTKRAYKTKTYKDFNGNLYEV